MARSNSRATGTRPFRQGKPGRKQGTTAVRSADICINSEKENQFLHELVARSANRKFFWIGGYQRGDGKWKWLTGEPFEYTNWRPNYGAQGGNNVVIYMWPFYDGKWGEYVISAKPPFICEWEF